MNQQITNASLNMTCEALMILFKTVKDRKIKEILKEMENGEKNGQCN